MINSVEPLPLPAGTILGERFELVEVIGRGGFGIAYIANDLVRRDLVVIKELAPAGTNRRADGYLNLESLGENVAHRLRRRFLDEAKLLSRLNLRAVPQVRATGSEQGTAFFATAYFADAVSLDRLLAKEGRLSEAGTLDIVFQLLEILGAVHARGILHRDIKPSNVLLRSNGEVLLIDFGAAREWHADYSETQTVLFTPGYAPIEQFSERGYRGPATDLYGLAATAYTLLAGFAPPSSMDRINGVALLSLRTLRPEMDIVAASAIESALALHYEARPATAESLRARFEHSSEAVTATTLQAQDLRLLNLKSLAFGRRQCPGCAGLMEDPRPLALKACPVCRKGRIRSRELSEKLCASCSSGVLREVENIKPLAICPMCAVGLLQPRKLNLLSKLKAYSCPHCDVELTEQVDGFVQVTRIPMSDRLVSFHNAIAGEAKTWEDWAANHPRSRTISVCDSCAAQYDHEPDGQWRQVYPKPTSGGHRRLYPEEWARVAKGLDPGAGTHFCDHCEADYFGDLDKVTLLGAEDDPYGFAELNMGRLLTWEDLRWMGVGKVSPHPGLTCSQCQTEFDHEGEYWRLMRTQHRPLLPWVDAIHTWPDWHRLAQELPRIHEENSAEETLRLAIVDAYRQGELDFDDRGTVWRGPAERLDPNDGEHESKPLLRGTLVVTQDQISLGGMFKKEKILIEVVEQTEIDGHRLSMWLRGESEPILLNITDIEMTVHLRSGDRTVILTAPDLAARLRHQSIALAGP